MAHTRILGVTWEPWNLGKDPELLLGSSAILTVAPSLVNPLLDGRQPLPTHAGAGVTW